MRHIGFMSVHVQRLRRHVGVIIASVTCAVRGALLVTRSKKQE
jgi:hypothetical protein